MSARPTLADLIALAEQQAPSRPPPGAEFAVPQELDEHAYYVMGPEAYSAAVRERMSQVDRLPAALRALVYETGRAFTILKAWARGDSEAYIIEYFRRTYNTGGYHAEAQNPSSLKLKRASEIDNRHLLKAARRARARRNAYPKGSGS